MGDLGEGLSVALKDTVIIVTLLLAVFLHIVFTKHMPPVGYYGRTSSKQLC